MNVISCAIFWEYYTTAIAFKDLSWKKNDCICGNPINEDYRGTKISLFFSELVKGAGLKFSLPANYAYMDKDEMKVNWNCSTDHNQFSMGFHQFLNNPDSSVLIGITIFAKYPVGSPGHAKTNWKENAKKRDERQKGKNSQVQAIDTAILRKVWNTDYEVVYSRPCTIPYKARYALNKIVSIGHDDWEIELVYFYTKPKEIKFIEMASSLLRPN